MTASVGSTSNQLSIQLAGTNEFTLKKGFKELFGTTVFGFWNDLKMGQAHQLLLDKQYNVGEVSSGVYRNLQYRILQKTRLCFLKRQEERRQK